jgi:hypothetical protein
MRPSFAVFAVSTALVGTAALGAAAPAFADGAALDKLSTHLYYHQTGAIDDRDAAKLNLWNTIIGEGDAQGPSAAVVVRVTVTGAETLARGAVEVTASSGRKKVFKQRLSLDAYVAEKGHPLVVPFVVYGTGCDSLEIAAVLQDGRKSLGRKAEVVPFTCGE